jgi:hypothetical protein
MPGAIQRSQCPQLRKICASLALTIMAYLVADCAGAPPKGCECIGKSKALELLGKSTQHDKTKFGEDYGSYCAAWEDGQRSAVSCANDDSKIGHRCGTSKGCNDIWPSKLQFRHVAVVMLQRVMLRLSARLPARK